MNIAVSADGKGLDSQVSAKFEKCLYLLIVNMDDLGVTVIENDKLLENSSGENLANEILKHDCEALITGNIEAKAFNILADACVTRFLGTGYSAKEALGLMDKNSLKLIRNLEGTDHCTEEHD